jgi:hypothetical protein
MWHATCKQVNQGDSWLLMVKFKFTLWLPALPLSIICVFKYSNGTCKPILDILISKSFNDIKNFWIEWVLTLEITFWKFGNPSKFQLTCGLCVGSFPHTLLHSWEHEMSFLGLTLSPHLCKLLPSLRAQG